MRSRTAASSALSSSRSNTPHAFARQMITMSRGAGMSSPNSTPMMRSRTSCSASPSTTGYRRARATLGDTAIAPSLADCRMSAATSRSSATARMRSASSATRRTQYSASWVSPLSAMRASTGSNSSSFTGAASVTISCSASVSMRCASARSINTAPAKACRKAVSGTNARSPASSFKSSSSSSSAKRNMARSSAAHRDRSRQPTRPHCTSFLRALSRVGARASRPHAGLKKLGAEHDAGRMRDHPRGGRRQQGGGQGGAGPSCPVAPRSSTRLAGSG